MVCETTNIREVRCRVTDRHTHTLYPCCACVLRVITHIHMHARYTHTLSFFLSFWTQEFACNGTVVQHPEYREVMQLTGDQRNHIMPFSSKSDSAQRTTQLLERSTIYGILLLTHLKIQRRCGMGTYFGE